MVGLPIDSLIGDEFRPIDSMKFKDGRRIYTFRTPEDYFPLAEHRCERCESPGGRATSRGSLDRSGRRRKPSVDLRAAIARLLQDPRQAAEAVEDARVASHLHGNARRREAVAVRFALVAEQIVLGGDDERGRKTDEIGRAGGCRVWVLRVLGPRQVVVSMPPRGRRE